MSPKEEFIAIFTENIKREGARELLAWLETTDFFSAPASTKFHCACEGGLVQHSLSVYHTLMDRYFEEGKVVFFAGGTGHPYFSTDTGITLRAVEMDADCILLAKSIDGVYDSDPAKNPDAKRYDTISIQEVIDRKLAVVDLTASIMCLEHKMPMAVFDLNEKDSIANAMQGKINGTIVTVD